MANRKGPVAIVEIPNARLDFPLPGISLTYLLTFDLGSLDSSRLTEDELLERFGGFVVSSYVISENEIRSYATPPENILGIYKAEMYERRLKNSVLSQRTSVMMQLPTKDVVGIFHPKGDLVSADQTVKVDFTCTLNSIGVGFLAMWIHLGSQGPFSFTQMHNLRDIQSLTSNVDWRLGPGDGLRLLGRYSFADLAKFVILVLYSTLSKSLHLKSINHQLGDESIYSIHSDICKKLGASKSIDHYPVFHVDLTSGQGYCAEAATEFVQSNGSLIRGIVTGDANWNRKKPEVVSTFIDSYSFSTRSSLFWFTHPNGSMKIYSSDLETPLLTSMILIVFELELVLTMRYCLYKLIANLNSFSTLSRNTYPIRRLTKLRDQELRRLDDYYNLDILQKDTTVKRLSSFRKMLNIDEILQIADRKFDSLNSYMNTEYQNASAQRQFALSIIFGVFGAGTLAFNLIRQGIDRGVLKIDYWQHLGWVGAAMLTIILLISLWFSRMRMQ